MGGKLTILEENNLGGNCNFGGEKNTIWGGLTILGGKTQFQGGNPQCWQRNRTIFEEENPHYFGEPHNLGEKNSQFWEGEKRTILGVGESHFGEEKQPFWVGETTIFWGGNHFGRGIKSTISGRGGAMLKEKPAVLGGGNTISAGKTHNFGGFLFSLALEGHGRAGGADAPLDPPTLLPHSPGGRTPRCCCPSRP